MLFANDYNDKRVHIDETHSNQEYYCPFCGTPLITRKGDIKTHHFAHKANRHCSDSWASSSSKSVGYDSSPWHYEWQSMFPRNNQEIKLDLGGTKHRADVLIDRTVVEFQHSLLSEQHFDDRNNFYSNLGYKVIWLFDLSDLISKGKITYAIDGERLAFVWENPKKAFNSYDVNSGSIDLFFQLNDTDEKCIVRVEEASEFGFEVFYTSHLVTKAEFLNYVGLNNGACLPPCRDDMAENEKFVSFRKKYDIHLNKQQERAVQAVEGSNLLLAVPGSGKTTVLITRIGHMIINKGIVPESILAVTYNKAAQIEMKSRFAKRFGKHLSDRVEFSTINALCNRIYSSWCNTRGKSIRNIIENQEKRSIIIDLLKKYSDEFPSENDVLELLATFTYIKNMGLETDQILEVESEIPHLNEMYEEYNKYLKANQKMDFDDQMRYAKWILDNTPDIVETIRRKYKYICVDEAQDTSKIQHEIIQLIAKGNNLFMVGDEDQSIYGFRGAYPRALLNFRYDYKNPYILRMERNYRSTSPIVDKAQLFISQNKGRYEKNMTSERGDGEAVCLQKVVSREKQYEMLLDVAKKAVTETAFLYRDNESAVVLVDLMIRNNIPFRLKKPEMNFFGNRIVRDIIAFLSLALNDRDIESFERISNRGVIFLNKQQKQYVVEAFKKKHIGIYDAVELQIKYVEEKKRTKLRNFRRVMQKVANVTASEAINLLISEGYDWYIRKNSLDYGKIEILRMLAEQEPDIVKFLCRLKELENLLQNESIGDSDCNVILSTIHSSKGLEYDTVYMVDVYDGRFPSARPNVFSRSKDNADAEQEERRLFYVGITRAKNKLNLIKLTDRKSTFIDILFPEENKADRNNTNTSSSAYFKKNKHGQSS